MQPRFHDLDSFIGGWFHQDFDIAGNTLEEIMDTFRRDADTAYQRGIVQDIHTYLAEHPDDVELEKHFYATFQPDLVEGAFGTAREFLTKIASLLNLHGDSKL